MFDIINTESEVREMTKKERAIRNLKQMCSDGRYLGSGSF